MRKSFGLFALLAVSAAGCSSYEAPQEDLPPVVSQPLIGAPAKPLRTIAGLMFDLGAGPPDAARAESTWMTATNSVRGMYIEASYGVQDIDVDFLGPYTLPVANKCLTLACCGPSSDRTGNGTEVQRIIDALPMDYLHYAYLYGQQTDSGCGTWGDEGNPNRVAVYSSYEGSSLIGGAQEIGHNLGMVHEHTMSCGAGVIIPDDLSGCTNVEYGSRLSFMGNGQGHPSGYHKAHMGWLSGCNVVKAGGAGTYTLFPLETPCNATQLLQVAAPKSRTAPVGGAVTHYYLELRVPVGYDSRIVNGPQVLIYLGHDLSTASQSSRDTFLLDLTPNTSGQNDAGLATVGQSFADPGGGLTFTLDAISMTSASVRVTGGGSGASTCSNGMAFTAPGPTDCGMGTAGMGGMGGSGTATGGSGGSAQGGGGGSAPGGSGGSAPGGTAGSGTSGSGGSVATGGTAPTGGTTTTGGTGTTTGGSSTGGASTGGGAGSPSAGAGTSTPAQADAEQVDSGCGCRTAGRRSNGSLVAGLLLLGLVRRRRARA